LFFHKREIFRKDNATKTNQSKLKFDKYPGGILKIEGGQITNIKNQRWHYST
jgi:hypothetical protein